MHESSIFVKLTNEYYQFTAAEKKVADYVVSNSLTTQTLSISELAEACGVADATVSRFCRHLGYEGFAAFKLAIATSAATRQASNPLSGEVTEEDSIPDLAKKLAGVNINAILETQALLHPETIEKAADVLLAADKVLCMGEGGSMIMAQEAAHLFSTAFSGFFPVTDSHLQAIAASQLTQRDAILYFSYSGATTGLMDVTRVAKAMGAPLILITRYPKSPGANDATIVLQCGSTESPLQLGSIPARVAQLYLVDILFSEACHRDLEGVRDRRALVAQALSDKHV